MTGAPPRVGRVVVTPRRQRLATAAQVHDGAGEITRRGMGTTLRAARQVRRAAGRMLVAVKGVPPQDVGRRLWRLTVGRGSPASKLHGAIDRSPTKRESCVVCEISYIGLKSRTVRREPDDEAGREIEAALWRDVGRLEAEHSAAVAE